MVCSRKARNPSHYCKNKNGRPMLKRRIFWVFVMLAVLLAGTMTIKQQRQGSATAATAAAAQNTVPGTLEFLPSDITQVTPHDLRQILTVSGSLRAVNQVSVKARVAGEVRDVLVREGEAVKTGQILIRIDPADYQARLAQAKGALLAARGQLDIATKARDNNQALLAKGFISRNAFDNAASQYEIAAANVESARGALGVAQNALEDTVLRAPITGLVSSRTVQPGEKVSPDNRLLDVVDLRQMEMEAAVPAADITHIAQGQEVAVSVEGLPAPLTGKVARINPATQAGSRSILVYIQVDNPQGVLRAGMFGEAQLTLARKNDVLTVPQSALQTSAGNASVFAVEGGKLVRKPVTLGIRGNDGEGAAVEILGGLENGARIVKTNLGNLNAGSVIKIAKAATETASAAVAPAQ